MYAHLSLKCFMPGAESLYSFTPRPSSASTKAPFIEDGATVLDLDRCLRLPCPPSTCPWKAPGLGPS